MNWLGTLAFKSATQTNDRSLADRLIETDLKQRGGFQALAEKQTSQDDQTLQSLSTTSLPRKTTQAETLVQGLLGILLVTTSGGYLPWPFPRKLLVEDLCIVT